MDAMDKYFKLPENYACIQRNSNQLYAFSSDYRTRDTYELDNFLWVRISRQTSVNPYNTNTCLPSDMTHLIPESVSGYVFASMIALSIVLVVGLFKVFSR